VANVLEIEVDMERNGNWNFLPLGRTIRGRMDFTRELHAESIKVGREDFPKGIPGQRLTLNMDCGPTGDAEATITDPIPKDDALMKQLKKRNMQPPTEKETFPVHKDLIPSWLYWLKRGVEAGFVKVLRGKLPDKVDGKVIKRFSNPERQDVNAARLDNLTAILFGMLSPEQKKAAEALLAAK
jgi:hypothetical protein